MSDDEYIRPFRVEAEDFETIVSFLAETFPYAVTVAMPVQDFVQKRRNIVREVGSRYVVILAENHATMKRYDLDLSQEYEDSPHHYRLADWYCNYAFPHPITFNFRTEEQAAYAALVLA